MDATGVPSPWTRSFDLSLLRTSLRREFDSACDFVTVPPHVYQQQVECMPELPWSCSLLARLDAVARRERLSSLAVRWRECDRRRTHS
jgi:hypothetical protein